MELPLVALALLYHKGRGDVLHRVLNSIAKLTYPKSKIYLILVNNEADEKTCRIVNKWLEMNEILYRKVVHVKMEGNVPHLRNFCLKEAIKFRCNYIFFVDSDVILVNDAIERLLRIFKEYEKCFAACLPYFIPLEKDTIFVRVRTKYGKGSLAPLTKINKPYSVPSTGMGATMIDLSLIPIVGFFDEEVPFIEDLNLTRRATKMGFKVMIDPRVQLLHDKTMSTWNWLKLAISKLGDVEAKNLIKVGTWRDELRGLIYWTSLIISLPIIYITPVPFLTIYLIGYLIYTTKFKGLGKIIGFPIISIYKIARTIGILKGLFKYLIEMV